MPGIDDPKDPTSQITGSCPCPALPEGMVVVRVDYLNAALALWREQRGIKGDCNCPGCREVRSYFKIILEGK